MMKTTIGAIVVPPFPLLLLCLLLAHHCRAESANNNNNSIDEFRVVFASILRVFADLDANRDGQLSFSEWAKNAQTGFLGNIRFEEFDESGDGHLDREEFIQEHFRAALGPTIVLKFQEADVNKDGQVDEEEWKVAMDGNAAGMLGPMEKWDENGDGHIDSREFVFFYYEKFGRAFDELGDTLKEMERGGEMEGEAEEWEDEEEELRRRNIPVEL